MSKPTKEEIQDAAERVRTARTFAAFRRDEESARELGRALAEFNRLTEKDNG